MTRSSLSRLGALLVAVASLTIAACGGDEETAETADRPFNATDVSFVQNMLPHHMQALRTSEVLLERGEDPQVTEIAREIVEAQQSEIEEMQGFLRRFKAPEKPAPADQQQVWDKNVADERAAETPRELETVFLTNMIPHHSAAVPMSQMEIEKGTFGPARDLAQQIKMTQRQEIMEMTMMLRERAAS
jgi:uncharacterized protein (DUF305 family)